MVKTLTSYSTRIAAKTRCERVRGLALTVAAALCALLALSAGVAHAEVPRLVPNGEFASDGGLGVAVDQASGDEAGDVFVTGFVKPLEGFNPGRSEKFDASDKLLSPPSPFAEGAYYGAAVNPTNGDLYVASEEANAIDTYDPNTGELLSSFPVPAFSTRSEGLDGLLDNLAQIATDSAGNVYVPNVPGNEVLEYSPTPTVVGGVAVPLAMFTGSEKHALSGPTGVAVDSSGDVWVADRGNNRIEEFSPTGEFKSEVKSEGVRALALDGHGDVLAIVDNNADFCGSLSPPCAHLVEYSSNGAQLADLGAGDFGAVGFAFPLSMVAVDEKSGRVYVTDGAKSLVWVFQSPLAPVLGEESSVEVGTSEAKLGALVNSRGAQTTYRFEYDTREYRQGEGPHGVSVPFPEGSVGEGFSSRMVWASASGLAPGTTYHYRAVVTNGVGTVVGPDQTFTTETAAQAACSNERLRGGFSTALPDCRAYEIVTSPSKASAQPDTNGIEVGFYSGGGAFRNYAASDGNRMSYLSTEVMPGSQSAGLEFVATRGASGWTSEDMIPLQSYTADRCPWHGQSNVEKYSADLSKAVLFVNGQNAGYDGGTEACRGEVVEVVPGEPLGVENLLLRDNTDGTYQLINVTPPGVTPADAHFDSASSDLRHICFSERAQLTSGAPAGVENEYEWTGGAVHLVTASAQAECRTANSEAGGYSYFSSESVLSSLQANQFGETAESGKSNLYVDHGGAITFVWHGGVGVISSNGAFFAVNSTGSLTGYDNNGASEIYLYSAASNRFACASCNPSGEAPTAGGVSIGEHVPRSVSDNGQVFFQTAEALLPRDTNGVTDVYEYDFSSGLHLISSGTSSSESILLDSSLSGDDVFFLTRQALLPGEPSGESLAIYDARVDGGFPKQASSACTTADACRAAATPQPSIFGEPSSQTFSGAGNLTPPPPRPAVKTTVKSKKCKRGFTKRENKCVRKKNKKQAKRASRDRRAK